MPTVASAAKKLDSRSGRISAPAHKLTASIIEMPMRVSSIAEMASTAAAMSTTSAADTASVTEPMLRRLSASDSSANSR